MKQLSFATVLLCGMIGITLRNSFDMYKLFSPTSSAFRDTCSLELTKLSIVQAKQTTNNGYNRTE